MDLNLAACTCILAAVCGLQGYASIVYPMTKDTPDSLLALLTSFSVLHLLSLPLLGLRVRARYFVTLVTNRVFPLYVISVCLTAFDFVQTTSDLQIWRIILSHTCNLCSIVFLNTRLDRNIPIFLSILYVTECAVAVLRGYLAVSSEANPLSDVAAGDRILTRTSLHKHFFQSLTVSCVWLWLWRSSSRHR
jgi:hypothetical protein